jgi:hypothetical protein
VHLAAGVSQALGEAVLDRGVAVLVGAGDGEAALPGLGGDGRQLAHQPLALRRRQHADLGEHHRVGGAGQGVPGHQLAVELRVVADGEALDHRVERLALLPQAAQAPLPSPPPASSSPAWPRISLWAVRRMALMRMKPRASVWS